MASPLLNFAPTLGAPASARVDQEFLNWLQDNFSIIFAILRPGMEISGTFTSDDGKTITVVEGIVTEIAS